MLFEILQIVQFISASLVIFLVLFHAAKGEGIGSIGSSAQMFKTASKLERTLDNVTWAFTIVFFTTSALLGWGLIKP